MHELVHHTLPNGDPYPMEECRIYKAFREGEGVHVDNEVMWRADGTSFPAEYWSYPMQKDGRVVGSVLTFVDINDSAKERTIFRSRSGSADSSCLRSQSFVYGHLFEGRDREAADRLQETGLRSLAGLSAGRGGAPQALKRRKPVRRKGFEEGGAEGI